MFVFSGQTRRKFQVTVKASNFGRHGYGLFLSKSATNSGETCMRTEPNQVDITKICLELWFLL